MNTRLLACSELFEERGRGNEGGSGLGEKGGAAERRALTRVSEGGGVGAKGARKERGEKMTGRERGVAREEHEGHGGVEEQRERYVGRWVRGRKVRTRGGREGGLRGEEMERSDPDMRAFAHRIL